MLYAIAALFYYYYSLAATRGKVGYFMYAQNNAYMSIYIDPNLYAITYREELVAIVATSAQVESWADGSKYGMDAGEVKVMQGGREYKVKAYERPAMITKETVKTFFNAADVVQIDKQLFIANLSNNLQLLVSCLTVIGYLQGDIWHITARKYSRLTRHQLMQFVRTHNVQITDADTFNSQLQALGVKQWTAFYYWIHC